MIEKQIWKPAGSTRNNSTNDAKFALANAQSVRNRTALFLYDSVTANNIDMICITETWLTQLDTVDIPALEGNNYTFSHIVRYNGPGGRVGELFKSTFTIIITIPMHFHYFEGLTVTLKTLSCAQFTIVVIYRPPSAPIRSYIEPFNSVLQTTYGKMLSLVVISTFITITRVVV